MSIKTVRSTMLRFIILFFLLLPLSSLAADSKYPPYPEIWGYDPYKNYKGENRFVNLRVFKVAENDYWFSIDERIGFKSYKKTMLVKFFEGTTQDLYTKEDKERLYYTIYPQHQVPYEQEKEAILSDGTKIALINTYAAYNKCGNEFIYKSFLEKRDSKGALLGRYSVLHILPKPFEFIEGDQRDECPTFSKGKIYIQVTSRFKGIVGLADDTVLVYDWDGNILRLDKDLKTKYDSRVEYTTRNGQTIRTSFAIIPTEVIEKMRNEIIKSDGIPFQETLQNRLLDYISKNYN